MSDEITMYMEVLENCIEKHIIIGAIVSVLLLGALVFRVVKKEKVYAILTIIVFVLFSVYYSFTIKDAFIDYKEQAIIVERGTIIHNVSDSFFSEDISFIPKNSNESIAISDTFLSGVDCPYGEYSATIVYGENSKILLYVSVEE